MAEFCEGQDQESDTSDEDAIGEAVADALSSFPDQCAAKVLDALKRGEEVGGWLEFMAMRIAGRIQLEESIPYLIDLLLDADLWTRDEALWTLKRIGTDSVVQQLASRYAAGDTGLRMAIANLLKDIHTDLSVQTCMALLDQEQDQEIRGFLIQSVLMNFSPEGIEPAGQFVLSTPKSLDSLEIWHDLLVASKMMGVPIPEFEAWTETAKTDKESRLAWHKDRLLNLLPNGFEEGDDEPLLGRRTG